MTSLMDGDRYDTRDKLLAAEDDEIISDFLRLMIYRGVSWPDQFKKEENLFRENPCDLFDEQEVHFVFVKDPREVSDQSNSDGCAYGCWRIIGGDKLIKSKATGKVLGFKKILKFCVKTKPREYKRNWIMEEYRLLSICKQEYILCKISFLFQHQISYLLAKHLSFLHKTDPMLLPIPDIDCLPVYGETEEENYLLAIFFSGEQPWPTEITTDVYRLDPLKLVNLHDDKFWSDGMCFFTNRTCDTTDKCETGYWKLIESNKMTPDGFKRIYRFKEKQRGRYVFTQGMYRKITFYIEEYKERYGINRNKLMCTIKAKTRSI